MKPWLAALPIMALSLPALAQAPGNTVNVTGTSSSTSGVIMYNYPVSTSNGTNTVNSAARVKNSGTQRILSAPPVGAPSLAAAGLETCLGSMALGLSVPGAGANFGTTTVDKGCDARLDARTLAAFGLKNEAFSRLCMKEEIALSMPQVCASAIAATRAATLVPVVAQNAAPLTAVYASKDYVYTQEPPSAAGPPPCKRYELLRGCVDHLVQ